MECPKCGAEIDKNAMVCPNCKKVLKIVCPECKAINTSNICRKCGQILVTKCAKCGKINLTKNKKCVKCGYSTEISAILAETNADNFAILRIDFPNLDIVKATLGSNKLFEKFKTNFDNLIKNYLKTVGVRRQIINNEIYIIRFNKDYTFSASAKSAMEAVIALLNIVTKINVKLLDKKQVALKCNFTIMRREADQDPYDIDSKFRANMVYQTQDKSKKALDYFQVTTDENFYEIYRDNDYKIESLDSALIDGQMKRFYELDLKEFVEIDQFTDDIEYDESNVPDFIQSALQDQEKITKDTLIQEKDIEDDGIYDIDMINFDEINCSFIKTESINVLSTISDVLQKTPKGILAIKASDIYQPYTLKVLSIADELGIYENIIPVTCNDQMKYTPYSFFKDLISGIFNYAVSQRLVDKNDFSMFKNIGGAELVKDLITLNQRSMENLETTRDNYFKVFLSLLEAIPNTIIYIENFEKIDSSSMYALEQLFDHLEDLNISYMVTYDKNFSLHKNAHFLLSRPYYTEIALTPTPDDVLINTDKDFYQNIMNDFYFQRILKYACGSTLFMDFAVQYLVESGVYQYTDTSIKMINPQTIIIPSGLDKLIQRRLNLLTNNIDAIRFLAQLVLLGTRVDEKSVEALNIMNRQELVQTLTEMGYIYTFNNCIYFSNYNIVRKCVLDILKPEDFQAIAQNLFDTVLTENMPSLVKAYLHDLLNDGENVIFEWEKIANVSLSMGDISAYLNCSSKILEGIEKYADTWAEEELKNYQHELFENISNNMYEYIPSETKDIAEKTLINLQQTQDFEKYISLCAKMIQGSVAHGEYYYALNLTHNILSTMDKASIDPSAPNFDLNYLLMSVIYVKILFNIGAYNDCLDIGYNILNIIDTAKLNSINYTIIPKDEFKYLITECIGYIAIVDVITMKEDVGEFLNTASTLLDFIPQSYTIFVHLQNLIKGQTVELKQLPPADNAFSAILYHIINAFATCKEFPETFAQEIYKAKLIAKDTKMFQFEIFADLLIGYAYIKRESYKKAASIIYKIIKTAKEKGMNAIVHTAWYIMSILNITEGKFDIAYGVLNNSNIQMEKIGGISDYLTLLNKVNMHKVLMNLEAPDQAQICLNQASYLVQKYGLNFDINVDN